MNDILVDDISVEDGIPIEEFFEDGTVIMAGDPAAGLTAEYAVKAAEEIETEGELAALFAMIHSKTVFVEDEIYDYEEGTDEWKRAVENAHFWLDLERKLRDRIFAILRAEGVEIPATRQIVVLEPFMKRNGYFNGRGWWIKLEDQ